jgi:hypothetical protein
MCCRTLLRTSLILALLVAVPVSAQSTQKDRRTSVNRGEWSSQTVSLFNTWGGLDSNPGRVLTLPSPDGKKVIQVRNERVGIVIDGKAYRTKLGEKTSAELGWAPDSQHFFLTWTDGGDTGTWHTEVYSITKSGIKQVTAFENHVRNDFEHRIRHLPMPRFAEDMDRQYWLGQEYCDANLVGAQWLNDSQELLVSALVPNVGDCRYMSTFAVYRVAVPSGKILERYKSLEAYRKFGKSNLPRITAE